jgi:2-oxoglutarate dehydrogenase E1 component
MFSHDTRFFSVNGAQIMIDQFISSAEQKWYRQSGLVLLLPHGYEGQGPEHSSARLERFLQSVNEEPEEFPEYSTLDPQEISASLMKQTQNINMVVANPTTPANLYHLLRRQVHRMFRKPLILLSPKSLLKAPYCVSDIEDFGPGKRVLNVIPDELPDLVDGDKVRKVIFCTGKVYYDLIKGRTKNDIKVGCFDAQCYHLEEIHTFAIFRTLPSSGLNNSRLSPSSTPSSSSRNTPMLKWFGPRRNPETRVPGPLFARGCC